MNTALLSLLRPHYRDLQGYVSAGMEAGKNPNKIYMNANENPYELPGLEGYNRYPEPQPPVLRDAYAALYGVKPEQIVMTRGADEAIVVLTKLFCEPHQDSVLISSPAFGMYGVDARAMPCGVVDVPLLKQDGMFRLDVDGIVEKARDDAVKLIYICSPNNPTANVFKSSDIITVCKKTAGQAIVVLDETYIEFSDQESFTKHLETIPNLMILRTLSKSYSMAGMRMGTLLCGDTDFVDLVCRKALDAYPLPRASIAAALRVMDPAVQDQARQNIQTILKERDCLKDAFAASPLVRCVYPSDTNFLLIEMSDAAAFIQHCAAHDLILRDFTAKPLTQDCIRVSVGLPQDNRRLIELLRGFEGKKR